MAALAELVAVNTKFKLGEPVMGIIGVKITRKHVTEAIPT